MLINKPSKIVLIIILGAFILSPGHVWAQNEYEDLTVQDLLKIFQGLACWALSAAGLLVVIFMVLAGLKFFSTKGDSAKAGDAKRMLTQVFIAAVVIFGVGVIMNTVAYAVGAPPITPFSC